MLLVEGGIYSDSDTAVSADCLLRVPLRELRSPSALYAVVNS
jgi:hypothetical protein